MGVESSHNVLAGFCTPLMDSARLLSTEALCNHCSLDFQVLGIPQYLIDHSHRYEI